MIVPARTEPLLIDVPLMMKRLALLAFCTIASGALLAFSLPPHGLALFGWFVFVPVLLALRDNRSFVFGFVAGILIALVAAFIDASGFLLPHNIEDGESNWIYAGFMTFGVVIALSLGLWSASEKLSQRPWVMAAWAVVFEGLLLLYLPAHMALTQSRSTLMLYLSSWTAIWGVSYLVWLCNFWLITAKPKLRVAIAASTLVLTVTVPFQGRTAGLPIAMIQTRSFDAHELASLNVRASREVISVWPELSGEVDLPNKKANVLETIAKSPKQTAFVTTYEEPGNPKPFNVAHIFSGERISAGYQKRKPFAGETKMHASGSKPVAVTVGGVSYGLNICFDSCYPYVMRQTASLPHVDVILLPTLDPETSYGVIQAIHASYTPFRAAELGVPIVRADATAHSMAVDSYGRVLKELDCEADTIAVATVDPGKRWTFTTYAGDWFLGACVLLAIAGTFGKKRQTGNAVNESGVSAEPSDQERPIPART